MEYVLMDIKNFLKKLENGQMEIEAGQWELHKTLASMSKTVNELSNLKEDVADMRRSHLDQIGLIKELQSKLHKINQTSEEDQPVTVSESSAEYEGLFKRPVEQGYKKRKRHIHDEEIIEIKSQVSNEKSESELGESGSGTQQRPAETKENEFKADENEKNSDGESSRVTYKKDSYPISAQNQPKAHYPAHTNNDILQRYLKDSAKYFENKKSNLSETTFCSSKSKSEFTSGSETEIRPFWDEYSSKAPPQPHNMKNSSSKENSAKIFQEKFSVLSIPKKISCSKYCEKFESKLDLLKQKMEHRKTKGILHCCACGKGFSSKLRLKDHEAAHKLSSKGVKGFKCCYCSKVCCTPGNLTEHVRKCRTIIRKYKE